MKNSHSFWIRTRILLNAGVGLILLTLGIVAVITYNRELAHAKNRVRSPVFAAALEAECAGLIEKHQTNKEWLWKTDALTNYGTISSLMPQVVQITDFDGVLACEIQLTGGFSHSGIIYVPNRVNNQKQPVRGNWKIRLIRHHFYWYQE